MIRPFALVAALFGAAEGAASPELLSDVVWQEAYDGFQGYSGLWVADDGTRFITVSDRGTWAKGHFLRGERGEITAAIADGHGPLRDHKFDAMPPFHQDAEGLAVGPAGDIYVSFEGYHRVMRYARDFTDTPTFLHEWKNFWDLQKNSGMEALAISPEGTLVAIPERSGKLDRPFPVFRHMGGKRWDRESWSIPRRGNYLVTGADYGPDGRFYLLERDFLWYRGFATRIRSFAPGGPTGFEDERTLLETGFAGFDNLEGISVWRDASGAIVITMISDDNASAFQQTRFVEFRLAPDPS